MKHILCFKVRALVGAVIFILIPHFREVGAQTPGFFLDDWQGKTAEIPAFAEVEKPADDPAVTVTVDPGQVVARVPRFIYGNNAVTWDNGLRSNATAMEDLRNLNPHVLRWPGGNLSNNYFWNATYGNRPTDIPPDISPWYGMDTPNWQMSVDQYYSLLEETGSEGIICVNVSYARYGTGPDPVGKAAHMAAEWVRYDNGRTRFWELGNENFGNWQAGYEIDTDLNQDGQPRFISGQLYGQQCLVFIDSMRAAAAEVGSEIRIGAVAYDAESSYDQISEDWNEGMMPLLGDAADFMVVHSYFTPYDQDSPVSVILNAHSVPGEIMEVIENDMAEAGKNMIPVAMTEWNIFAVGSMQQVSYINGMLAAITLGEYVQSGYGLATRWDLVNNWNNGDDHGMFSTGGEPGVDQYNPRAAFYYMYYHQKFFGDRMVQSSVSGSNDVVAHASTFSSGETGLVIVNKGNTGKTLQVELENAFPGLNYYYYTLTGGVDNGEFSRKVLINGVETDEQGGGPDEYKSIGAFASGSWGGIKVSVPPLSVVYLLIEKEPPFSFVHAWTDTEGRKITVELTEAVQPITDYSGLGVLVNGSFSPDIDSLAIDSDNAARFHIYLNEKLTSGDEIELNYSGDGIRALTGTALTPFSGKSVDNLIPGGPYSVVIIPFESGTNQVLEGCRVTFNEQTVLTDSLGRALFEVLEGDYSLQAAKPHFDTLLLDEIRITSDTTLNLYLEHTSYELGFHLAVEGTGDDLAHVLVRAGNETKESGSTGMVAFQVAYGMYGVSFNKENFFEYEITVAVESDTVIEVRMKPSHAELKLRLKDGEQPIVGALAILGNDTLISNSIGNCVFSHVPLDVQLDYRIERIHYFPVQGMLSLHSDTTIEVQMYRSVASVEFFIEAATGIVENGYVVLDQDTLYLDQEGKVKYFNKSLNQNYEYLVGSSNHGLLYGSVFLVRDTVLSLLFTSDRNPVDGGGASFLIYPNPSRDRITIATRGPGIECVELVDGSGKIVISNRYSIAQKSLDLNLPPASGIYFLRIRTGSGLKVTRILKE